MYHVCSLAIVSFSFNHPPTTELYTLSLHDALPISTRDSGVPRALRNRMPLPFPLSKRGRISRAYRATAPSARRPAGTDRKSTRLNSSHGHISYAVFCLKKKKKKNKSKYIH